MLSPNMGSTSSKHAEEADGEPGEDHPPSAPVPARQFTQARLVLSPVACETMCAATSATARAELTLSPVGSPDLSHDIGGGLGCFGGGEEEDIPAPSLLPRVAPPVRLDFDEPGLVLVRAARSRGRSLGDGGGNEEDGPPRTPPPGWSCSAPVLLASSAPTLADVAEEEAQAEGEEQEPSAGRECGLPQPRTPQRLCVAHASYPRDRPVSFAIAAATADKLVERLTWAGAADSVAYAAFAATFLASFPRFMAAADLLKRLCDTFSAAPRSASRVPTAAAHSAAHAGRLAQASVVRIILQWVDNFPEDWRTESDAEGYAAPCADADTADALPADSAAPPLAVWAATASGGALRAELSRFVLSCVAPQRPRLAVELLALLRVRVDGWGPADAAAACAATVAAALASGVAVSDASQSWSCATPEACRSAEAEASPESAHQAPTTTGAVAAALGAHGSYRARAILRTASLPRLPSAAAAGADADAAGAGVTAADPSSCAAALDASLAVSAASDGWAELALADFATTAGQRINCNGDAAPCATPPAGSLVSLRGAAAISATTPKPASGLATLMLGHSASTPVRSSPAQTPRAATAGSGAGAVSASGRRRGGGSSAAPGCVTECGAVEIAHLACAITRRDHALLQQLRARDLLVQFGRRDGGQVEAAVADAQRQRTVASPKRERQQQPPQLQHPRVAAITAQFRLVAGWAAASVLRHDRLSLRRAAMERLVALAVALRQLRNFAGLFAVLAGINHEAVLRLRATRAAFVSSHASSAATLSGLQAALRRCVTRTQNSCAA